MPQPIDVFFWTTPNCCKVTIALEEMELPYVIRPVAIGMGEQFKPEFLAISPNNRVPAIVDREVPGGLPCPSSNRAPPPVSGAQDRPALSERRARPRRGGPMAFLADGRRGPDVRSGEPLPHICSGTRR